MGILLRDLDPAALQLYSGGVQDRGHMRMQSSGTRKRAATGDNKSSTYNPSHASRSR